MRIFLAGEQEVIVSDDIGANDIQAAQAAQLEINLLRDWSHGIKNLELFFEFMIERYCKVYKRDSQKDFWKFNELGKKPNKIIKY